MKKRYSEELLDEYALVRLVVPHYDEIRKIVGDQVKSRSVNLEQEPIYVLDLGSGSGYTTERVLLADPRVNVVGVDIEPVIIRQAEKNLGEYIENRRLRLVLNDALAYMRNLESESLDMVVSTFVIHNFEKDHRSKVYEELFRVLKIGGLFVNGDKYARDDNEQHQEDFEKRLQRFRDVFGRIERLDLANSWISHCLDDNVPGVLMKEGDAIKEMLGIGFSDVQKIYRKEQEAIIVAKKEKEE